MLGFQPFVAILAEHYMRPETTARMREMLVPEGPEEASVWPDEYRQVLFNGSTRIRRFRSRVLLRAVRLKSFRPNPGRSRTVRLRIASLWASRPPQVTPHPARSGW